MKRILRVVNTLDPSAGGIVAGVSQITPYLYDIGIDTTFLTYDPPDSSFLHDFPYRYHAIGPGFLKYCYVSKAVSTISSLCRSCDHVFVEGLWQHHSYATMKALEHSSTPYSIFTHGMLDPWFNRTYPLKKLKKLLYWHLCEYHVLRNAANVIYTTEVERSLASTSFKKYKANEFVSGYGASSPSSIEENNATLFLHEFPHLRGKRLLLYLGRIHNKKGIDLFLKAFSMIEPKDNLHVVLAGPYTRSSPYYRYLVDLISRLNLSTYVTWCGMLSGSLKWSALNASYLFFLTSYQENFGVAVAEALSCKLPVLITDSVNISSIIRKNECGLVCAPAVDDIFRSLSRFLCLSSETKHRYSCNARKVFDDFFDLGIVARSLASIV